MAIADLIRAMSAAGAPAEAIALAVEAIEAAEDKLAEKRAIERDRKRRQRDKGRDSHGTVTGQSQDNAGTVTDIPPLSPPSPNTPQTPQEPLPPHTPPCDTPRARKAAVQFPCPEGVNPLHWQDFLANRKAKRLPNTATAHAGILRDLAKLADDEWPPGRLMQAIVEKGWAGIHNPREEHRNGQLPTIRPTSLRGTRPNPALDMWRQANASIQAEGFEPDPARDFRAWPALPPEQSG